MLELFGFGDGEGEFEGRTLCNQLQGPTRSKNLASWHGKAPHVLITPILKYFFPTCRFPKLQMMKIRKKT